MSDGDREYHRKHFKAYIIFLVLLAIDYFLVPTEYFNKVLWVLLILFAIVDTYFLFTSRNKKNDYVEDDYRRKASIARIIFLGLLAVGYFFAPTDYLSAFIWPILILFIIIDAYVIFGSRKKK